MSSSTLGLLISLAAVGLYGYSLYSLYGLQNKFDSGIPKQLQELGLLKYLTIQCLLIQMTSSVLHVLAHFIGPLRGARDFVFTAYAFPVGSFVVYSFWLVWFALGRELIFPSKLDAFYPFWLNHINHTIIVPVNILQAMLINHKHLKSAEWIAINYLLFYVIFLEGTKARYGQSVYAYLDEMSQLQRTLYFVGCGVFVYLNYHVGKLITKLAHGRARSP